MVVAVARIVVGGALTVAVAVEAVAEAAVTCSSSSSSRGSRGRSSSSGSSNSSSGSRSSLAVVAVALAAAAAAAVPLNERVISLKRSFKFHQCSASFCYVIYFAGNFLFQLIFVFPLFKIH